MEPSFLQVLGQARAFRLLPRLLKLKPTLTLLKILTPTCIAEQHCREF
jgi:hypothetical protein